jgi:hypothetical protein
MDEHDWLAARVERRRAAYADAVAVCPAFATFYCDWDRLDGRVSPSLPPSCTDGTAAAPIG